MASSFPSVSNRMKGVEKLSDIVPFCWRVFTVRAANGLLFYFFAFLFCFDQRPARSVRLQQSHTRNLVWWGGFRKTGLSHRAPTNQKWGEPDSAAGEWNMKTQRKTENTDGLVLSRHWHGAYINQSHTRDGGGWEDVFSGRRPPKHNRSSAWISSEQPSPALCETSAHPPETASSTYSPARKQKLKSLHVASQHGCFL